MKKKILIFTATYNEAENIKKFIFAVDSLNLPLDLLIIDDNSPDKTYEIIENYKSNNIKINLIKRKKKLGLDTAHKFAYSYAVKNSFQYLITMDSDLSHDPNEIPKFIKNLIFYKFVIGSRYINGGSCNMIGFRKYLSIYGNKFIKYVLGIKCHEFTTSYRGFHILNLKNFNLNLIKSKGYSFFMETIYQLSKKKIEIKEIPIVFMERRYGISKIPKIEIFRTMINLLKIKFFS